MRKERTHQPNPTGRPLPSVFARDFYVPFRTAKTPVGFIRVGLTHPPGTILTDAYSHRYQVKSSGAIEAIA